MTANIHASTLDANRYRQHVSDLARAFKVQVAWLPMQLADTACALANVGPNGQRTYTVQLAPVIDEVTYAVALHELGHCLAPLGMLHSQCSSSMRKQGRPSSFRDLRLQLDAEYAAWEWAERMAITWTDIMAAFQQYALSTYRDRAREQGCRIP